MQETHPTIEQLREQMTRAFHFELDAAAAFKRCPCRRHARLARLAEDHKATIRKQITAHPDYRVEGL